MRYVISNLRGLEVDGSRLVDAIRQCEEMEPALLKVLIHDGMPKDIYLVWSIDVVGQMNRSESLVYKSFRVKVGEIVLLDPNTSHNNAEDLRSAVYWGVNNGRQVQYLLHGEAGPPMNSSEVPALLESLGL
jgi:hypothetical protein